MRRPALPGKTLALVLLLLGSVQAGAGAAELALELEHPTRGEAVRVRISGVEDPTQVTLSAAYRPGSATEVSESVGTFDTDGSFAWSPTIAGLATVSARQGDEVLASRNVAVRFDSTPPLGILILLVAGVLLFGGTTAMLRRSLEE